jgi:hypothetical protein
MSVRPFGRQRYTYEDIASDMDAGEARREPKRESQLPTSSIKRAQKARVEKTLDKLMTFDGRTMSRREWLDQMLIHGKLKVFREQQYAAEEKLKKDLERIARNIPFGNPNHPDTKRYNELKAKLKAGLYKERIGIQLPSGTFYELNKTEIEYFEDRGGKR